MNAHSSLRWWVALGLALGMLLKLACAEESPAASLRVAVTKGLGFMAEAGEQWIENKNCNSCHHLPEMLWSHREARRRGFAVDEARYDAWREWAAPKTKDIRAGREEVAFMLLALPDAAAPAAEAQKIILEGVQKDGSWKVAGQFTMQRRGAEEAQLNSARLFLLALAGSKAGRKTAEEARARAAGWMRTQAGKPAASIETVAFQALYARRFGLQEEADKAVVELLLRQREDGGWSWITGDPQSDALGTGQALYALHQTAAAGDVNVAAAVRRAEQWLVSTQAADGSWPIKVTYFSKKDRSAPEKASSLRQATEIYTCWAAAWGTLGLLHGVPVTAVAAQ